jgi:DNA polymerase-3 subunit gamma/tau
VFLLATTEVNKIPDTILSRCQRYDLKRVTSKDIFKRLEYILTELEIKYEESALNLIISKSEGSVRDSLSILDQCLSYDDDLSYKVVVDILGIIETETLNNLLDTFIDNNINRAMVIVNNIFNEGKDIKQFVESVLNHFRNLLIVKMHSSPEKLIASSDVQLNFYKSQSEKFEMAEILRILNIFIDLEKDIKWSSHGKVLFEIAIVKTFNNTYDVSIEALMQRIKKLEEEIDLIKVKGIIKSEKIDEIVKIDKTKSLKYETNETIEEFIDESTKSNINLEEIVSKWNEVLKLIKKIRIKVYAFLIESEPIDVYGNKIILKLDKEYKFHGDNLMKPSNKETVETILEKVFLKKLTIDITYDDDAIKKNNKVKSINIEEEIEKYFTGYDKVLEIKK